jgi:hypothetical protein
MMTTTPNNMKMDKLADFAALAAWVIVCGAMATVAYIQFGQDFRGYYAAAHVLLEGGNPYDYFQVAPVLQEVTGRVGNNPFYYPLWFGWFIAPLALLPYPVARAVWMFLNLAAWMIGLTRLRGLLDFPRKGWRTWSLFLLGTFLFGWMTWKFEQTGILLFALTVESLIAYRDRQWTRMGVLLAAVLIKPNIMLIPVVILSLWLVRKRIYRPVAVMTALLAGLMLVTTLLTPDWYQPLFRPGFGQGLTEVLDGPEKTTGIRLNTTMMDWLKVSGLPDTVSGVLYAAAVVFCILLAARTLWKSESFMEVTIIALLVSFAVTPYALQYDFPPLVIPLFWALAAAHPATSKTIPILLTAFITSVLVWERPISDGYWIVIGVALLVAWSMKNPGTFARTNASMA